MDKDIKEMFEILIDEVRDVKASQIRTEKRLDCLEDRMECMEKEQKSLSNQVTNLEYKLTEKINGLYDGYEVMKDDIRRIERSVNKLVLADQDKDLKIRAIMSARI